MAGAGSWVKVPPSITFGISDCTDLGVVPGRLALSVAFASDPSCGLSLGDWSVLAVESFSGTLKRGDVANVNFGEAVDFEGWLKTLSFCVDRVVRVGNTTEVSEGVLVDPLAILTGKRADG